MRAHVDGQGLPKTERERAGGAPERFFASVKARVARQVRPNCESTGTELALERSLPRVNANVNYEVRPLSEPARTEAAQERLATGGVGANVLAEVTGALCGEGTQTAAVQAFLGARSRCVVGSVLSPLQRTVTIRVTGTIRRRVFSLRCFGLGASEAFLAKFCVR